MPSRLILASKSPRRAELLAQAGIPFEIRAAEIDESREPHEPPVEYVERLARAKAAAVRRNAGQIVLGADTVVVIDDDVLLKPADTADAARMLRLLSGRTHEVITGVCLQSDGHEFTGAETTRVRFLKLSEDEIAEYVASGEPIDKAGAYAIQGLAGKYIDRIEGCYFNVVGLPLARVFAEYKRLRQAS